MWSGCPTITDRISIYLCGKLRCVIAVLVVSLISTTYIFSRCFVETRDRTQIVGNSTALQFTNVQAHLQRFEVGVWYGTPRNRSAQTIPNFPPQMVIVKVCYICKTSYWIALPSHLTMKHYCFAGDNTIHMETVRGIWDLAETRLANAVLSFGCRSSKYPLLMVDVGMNTGYFSGMALNAGCRVVAFEPTKYHHPYAVLTSMLSGYQDRFTLHNLAASDKTGEMISYNGWSIDITINDKADKHDLVDVRTTRVDDVVHEDVLYLKIDVESHEPAVFRGLTKLLKNKIVSVILWEHSSKETVDSVQLPADYLKSLGYFICDIHHGGAGNYVALHPKIDPTLRETIMNMKEINIKDSLAHRGLNWYDY